MQETILFPLDRTSTRVDDMIVALEGEYLTNPKILIESLTAEDARANAAAAAIAGIADPAATVESMLQAAYRLRRIVEAAVHQDAANMAGE